MEEQPTCGRGLAEHSVLPGKLAELIASVAEILEVHTKALDVNDKNSRTEHAAYVELAKQHREIAIQLMATAKRMARCRNLPMGRHDQKTMFSRMALEVFGKFVELEQELIALLQNRLEQDRRMLIEMGGARGA